LILKNVSFGLLHPVYLPNHCKSLLQESKTFDIKTIFARRKTIFGDLFTFAGRVVAALSSLHSSATAADI
jgi:hypothetical protein